jgi:hypothetical protein
MTKWRKVFLQLALRLPWYLLLYFYSLINLTNLNELLATAHFHKGTEDSKRWPEGSMQPASLKFMTLRGRVFIAGYVLLNDKFFIIDAQLTNQLTN